MSASARWLTLDTAGKLFPAIESVKRTETFRLSATLAEPVDPEILLAALEHILPRFPNFKVRLRKGFFWYYLDPNSRPPVVELDSDPPSRKLDRRKSNGYLFRVFYRDCRISIELFHALTDGTGGMVLLKTLAAEYLRRVHPDLTIPCTDGIYDCTAPHEPEESEDAYSRYYKGLLRHPTLSGHVFRLRGRKEPHHVFHVTTGLMDEKKLKQAAARYGANLTEYLASVIILGLHRIQNSRVRKRKRQKTIRLSIPVNMRQLCPSKTLRNFTHYVTADIEPNLGEFTFEEILRQVRHGIKFRLNEKFLTAAMSVNVYLSRHPLIRTAPRIVKDKMILFVYKFFGENQYSSTLSNLGRISLPAEMEPFVKRINFNLPPNRINFTSSTMLSFGSTVYLTITSVIREPLLESAVFTRLHEDGVPITLETNYQNRSSISPASPPGPQLPD